MIAITTNNSMRVKPRRFMATSFLKKTRKIEKTPDEKDYPFGKMG
jgi:hypothetical protein